MVSYNDLFYFVELAQTLNFSRAAERIGISQPSLSAAVKRLERFVGAELFLRDKHKVLLTQAGKNLFSHSRQLLLLWDNTKASCLDSQNEVQGSITFGCHTSIALYFLPKFLPKLIEQYPNLEINLKHDLSRKIAEEIINYTVDIGIVVNPVKHPDLIIKKLFDDKVSCWQAADFKPAKEKINIICDPSLNQTQWLLKKLRSAKFQYHKLITTSSLETIANLTAAGAGIGIVPTRIITSLHHHSVKQVPHTPFYHDEICVVYRHENRNMKAVKTVAKDIRDVVV